MDKKDTAEFLGSQCMTPSQVVPREAVPILSPESFEHANSQPSQPDGTDMKHSIESKTFKAIYKKNEQGVEEEDDDID